MSARVIITPDENGNNPTVQADLSQNTTQLPVNISFHESQTIQTHNAVSVSGSNGSSSGTGTWIDCLGYSDLAVTLMNDAATSSYADIRWSFDGSTYHGIDFQAIPSNTNQRKSISVPIKARYAQIIVTNGDAAAHTMSAWAYLKC